MGLEVSAMPTRLAAPFGWLAATNSKRRFDTAVPLPAVAWKVRGVTTEPGVENARAFFDKETPTRVNVTCVSRSPRSGCIAQAVKTPLASEPGCS